MVIITCLFLPQLSPWAVGSQPKTRGGAMAACVCERVREREIVFITNWLHSHASSSGPQGWDWRATYRQDKYTHTHTRIKKRHERHTQTHGCKRREWIWEAGRVKWMLGKKAHHCGHWLAHFHFNYTAQWHCCAYTLTHKPKTTHAGPTRAHPPYPMSSHQPLLWAVHWWLQTESGKDR